MSPLVAAALAAASVAVLLTVPSAGQVRLAGLATAPSRRAAPRRGLVLLPPAAVTALLLGPGGAVVVVAALLAARRWVARRSRSVASTAERAGAVAACRMLAAELSAGRSPEQALAAAAGVAAGPAADALRAAATAAGLGGDVPAALLTGAEGSAVTPVLRSLAACWTVCASSGSGLAAAVLRLEDGLRAEQDLHRTLDAELAGPRATALLLAVLPGAGLLLAAGLGVDVRHVVLQTPVGLACLLAGLLLDGAGVLWTQRLVAQVRPP